MKVILLKDIPKIGKKYDIKDIADGFALNSLIPKGAVKTATPGALKEVEALKATHDAELKIQADILAKNLEALEGKTVEIELPANNQGHLFAGLHAEEVAEHIKKYTHVEVNPSFIDLPKPIKETGEHTIEISVADKKATLTLSISKK